MTDRQIIDTHVLIDYSRRRPEAVAFLRGVQGRPVVSAMTVAELYAGVRDGVERIARDRFVARSVVIDIDEQIAVRAASSSASTGRATASAWRMRSSPPRRNWSTPPS